jgi:capsular polysaccharide biosynthesis protein
MTLREAFKVIWRWRIVIVIVIAASIGSGIVYVRSQPKTYESAATIAFTPATRQGQFVPPESLSSLLGTYAVIARSSQTLVAASKILGRPLPGSVEASATVGSWILEISSEAASPQAAAETVGATTQAFIRSIHGNEFVSPTIINPPVAVDVPTRPRSSLIIAVASVAGILAALLLAFLIDSVRAPAIATVPDSESTTDEAGAVDGPQGLAAKQTA